MNQIKKIHICNFKAFPHEEIIELNGKNLLLFGENGSGKSSIYWALYTFLQSSEKKDADVNAYFETYDPNDEKTFLSLLNIHSEEEACIKLVFEDNTELELTKGNGNNTRVDYIKKANLASDFITYKLLYNFYGSTHKNDLNVWEVFKHDIFPYFLYDGKTFFEHYTDIYQNMPTTRRGSNEYKAHKRKIEKFNAALERELGDITFQANNFLQKYFDIQHLKIKLTYKQKLEWDTKSNWEFIDPHIKFHIEIKNGDVFVEQHRPQSFLNEAILAQLSLAIRLGALFTHLAESETKILVLDDLLISLDMDNREKVLDVLLKKAKVGEEPNPFENFQILFFTHDRGLNYFVGEKIKQHGRGNEWLTQELYAGLHENTNDGVTLSYAKPILIDGDLSDLEKAKRYLYKTKDYEGAALCIRKYIELILIKKLPKELAFDKNNIPKQLHSLWTEFSKYCNIIQQPIPSDITTSYNQSRLMILNPQAHYNFLNLPIYKEELKKAIMIAERLDSLALNIPTILLTYGMVLLFKYPGKDFSITLEIEQDCTMTIGDPTSVIYPKTKILTWGSATTEYLSPRTGNVYGQGTIIKKLDFRKNLKEMVEVIKAICDPWGFNSALFIENTSIKNCLWNLKDIFDKANISL